MMKRNFILLVIQIVFSSELFSQKDYSINGLIENKDYFKIPYHPLNNVFMSAGDIVFGRVNGVHYSGKCLTLNTWEPLLNFELILNEFMMPSVQIAYDNYGEAQHEFFYYQKGNLIRKVSGGDFSIHYFTYDSLGIVLRSDSYDDFGVSMNDRFSNINSENGVNPSREFNPKGQLIYEKYNGQDSTFINYRYDVVGRIKLITINGIQYFNFIYSDIDKYGNWTKCRYSILNGNEFEVSRKLFYTPNFIIKN